MDVGPMVEIIGTHRLSEFRDGDLTHTFLQDEVPRIRSAIESVPEEVFLDSEHDNEVDEFDSIVGEKLSNYSVEGTGECSLWTDEGFNHRVDLYHREKRIAIELQKSEKKYVWKDLAKFGRGAHTQARGGGKIKYGCLVVPDYYSGKSVFTGTRKILRFMSPMLDTEEIIIIGFHNPPSQ